MGTFVDKNGRYFVGDKRSGLIKVPPRPDTDHQWDFDASEWVKAGDNMEVSRIKKVRAMFGQITSQVTVGSEEQPAFQMTDDLRRVIASMRSDIHFILEDMENATTKKAINDHIKSIEAIFVAAPLPEHLAPVKQSLLDYIKLLYT